MMPAPGSRDLVVGHERSRHRLAVIRQRAWRMPHAARVPLACALTSLVTCAKLSGRRTRGGPSAEAATVGSSFATSETEDTLTVVFRGQRRVHDFEKLEQQWEFWPQATALCRRKGIRRVLVLNELVGEISSTYVRGLHLNLEDFGFDRSLRYAMVVAEPRARGVLTFGIELAKGLGWDIEIFQETASAQAWLSRPLS